MTCTYNLVKGLNYNGTSTDILTFKPDAEDILAQDDFIHYLPDDRFSPLWFSRNLPSELSKISDGYDIIHVNTIWTWPSHIGVTKALKSGKPLVISPHGMLYPQALKVSGWKKKLIAPLFLKSDLKHADCIHATSHEEANHIRAFGIEVPVAVIPNCICLDEYPAQRTTTNPVRKIGFIGRLNPIKNIDLLLNAWNSLGEQTRQAELIIIGDGEPTYVDYLKGIANKNDLNNISFRGFLSGDELKKTISALDYQILPSKSENFGMVVAEALACGVPSITCKGTPWKVLQDENAGWWVSPDVNTLAETISEAINLDEAKRRLMGQNGFEIVNREYSSISIAHKMTQLYDWLLGKDSRPDFII